MKKQIKITSLVALAIIFVTTFSCKKEKEVAYEDLPAAPAEAEATMTSVDTMAEQYTHVFSVVHTEVSNVEDQAFKTGSTTGDACAVITFLEVDSTDKAHILVKKMTIDYGTGCVWAGKTRKGKITVTKTDRFSNANAEVTLAFDSFSINGNELGGTVKIKNLGYSGSFDYQLTVTDGTIKVPNFSVLKFSGTISNYIYKSGNEYYIMMGFAEGSVGTDIQGASFNISSTGLKVSTECEFITKGKVNISYYQGLNFGNLSIDFGDGTCDDNSVMTVDGTEHRYTPRRHIIPTTYFTGL